MKTFLESLVADGTVTLIALAVLTLEIIALLWIRRGEERVTDLLANAVSGVFLILALRSSLVGHGPESIAAFLGVALAAHVVALAARLRR